MRPDEHPSFSDRTIDPCDEEQVQAWASRFEVPPDLIREACGRVGSNYTAVELFLTAPRA